MLTTLREISVNVSSDEAIKSDNAKGSPSLSVVAATPAVRSESKSTEDMTSVDPVVTSNSDTSSVSALDPRKEGSEAGTETEEDEGMVLVGRPP